MMTCRDFAAKNLHIYAVKMYDFQYDSIKWCPVLKYISHCLELWTKVFLWHLQFHILTRFTAQVWDFASKNLQNYTVKSFDFQYGCSQRCPLLKYVSHFRNYGPKSFYGTSNFIFWLVLQQKYGTLLPKISIFIQ